MNTEMMNTCTDRGSLPDWRKLRHDGYARAFGASHEAHRRRTDKRAVVCYLESVESWTLGGDLGDGRTRCRRHGGAGGQGMGDFTPFVQVTTSSSSCATTSTSEDGGSTSTSSLSLSEVSGMIACGCIVWMRDLAWSRPRDSHDRVDRADSEERAASAVGTESET